MGNCTEVYGTKRTILAKNGHAVMSEAMATVEGLGDKANFNHIERNCPGSPQMVVTFLHLHTCHRTDKK